MLSFQENYSQGSFVNILQEIAFPEFMTKMARAKTFTDWPKSKNQRPDELSDAGFFFTQKNDRTICFSCGGGLCDWAEQDDPWEQHALHYRNCKYLRLIKGEKFIENITNASEITSMQFKKPASHLRYVNNNCLLNDKVMLDIFKYFDIKNLISTAEVSLQFEGLAISTFEMKHKHFLLNNRNDTANDKTLIAIFRIFGRVMQTVETPSKSYPWYDRETQKLIIVLIKKYCANDTLRCSKLYNFSSIKRHLILLNNILPNLTILHLNYVAVPYSILQLLNKMPQIVEVEINYCTPILPINAFFEPNVNLNLQRISIRCRSTFNLLDFLIFYPRYTISI